MSTFVLVHGGGHGAWCWYKIVPRLEAAGHRVITPDMPGHGLDRTPLAGLTQHDYAAALVAVLDAIDEPVVLVGHSMGGMTVELAAEQRPDKVAAAVFLTAVVLRDGQSMMTHPELSADFAGRIGPNMDVDQQTGAAIFPPDQAAAFFYSDCDAADIALANRLIVGEPMSAMSTPIEITAERFSAVATFGIVTTEDRLNLPSLQRIMYDQVGVGKILTLDTSHSPFFSAPDALTEQLNSIAAHTVTP
jgi:pimeloyl-ACP methyl ester carboxylesterase